MKTIQYAQETLERHKCLVEKVVDNLKSGSSNSTETVYSMCGKRIIAEIHEEIQKVDQLELRMTVVASMKSGKSTIINALIGENILPTRANAMTIVPTEVIFKREVQESCLFLSTETIYAIEMIFQDVRNCLLIEAAKETETNELFENEPYMNKMVNEIVNSNFMITLDKEVVGPMQIQKSLLVIHDLIRLYLKLAAKNIIEINETNFQVFQNRIPRIEVPFPTAIIHTHNLGNLVLVDTPGPNEASMCGQLREIVTTELRKADVILIVFNYTALNTEADAKIMSEISELRKIRGDYDCLYAIVNKVDQRRKGDMSKDDVRKFIAMKYGIEERTTIDAKDRRVFEIKAFMGLIAKRFLIEYERLRAESRDLTIRNMQTVDDLGNELYPLEDWETVQETTTIEQLHKGAVDMWRKSGLDELLQTAVSSLMKSISSRVVESTLSKCQRVDRELIECLKLCQMVLDGNTGKLNAETQELEKELNLIKIIRSEPLVHLQPFLKSLRDEFEATDGLSSERVAQLISEWSTRTERKMTLLDNKFGSGIALGGVTTIAYWTLGLAGAALLGGLPLLALGAYYYHWDSTSDSIWFPKENKASEQFQDDVTDMIFKICNDISIKMHERIDTGCKQLSKDLYNSLIVKTSEILKRAEKVLNNPFEMKQPVFQPFVSQFRKESINKIHLEENRNSSFLRYDFYIHRHSLLDQCHQLINENLKQIQTQIEDWSRNILQNNFSSYLSELENYLGRYMDLMQSSLDNVNLSNTDRETFRQNLQHLINELNVELIKLTTQ